MQFLKKDTAATVKMGPFVDENDGVTAETSLTIAQADIRVSKNGGSFAQTHNAAGATHDENGYYGIPLDTSDTDTAGRLRVAVSESGALPAWKDFMVLPEHVYEALFGSGGDANLGLAVKMLVNKAVQDKDSGAVEYYDNDGSTVILTHTPTDGASEITRTPS